MSAYTGDFTHGYWLVQRDDTAAVFALVGTNKSRLSAWEYHKVMTTSTGTRKDRARHGS